MKTLFALIGAAWILVTGSTAVADSDSLASVPIQLVASTPYEPILISSDGNDDYVMRRDSNGRIGFAHRMVYPPKDIFYWQSWVPTGMSGAYLHVAVERSNGVARYDPYSETWNSFYVTDTGHADFEFTGEVVTNPGASVIFARSNHGIAVFMRGYGTLIFVRFLDEIPGAQMVLYEGNKDFRLLQFDRLNKVISEDVFFYDRDFGYLEYEKHVPAAAVNVDDCGDIAAGGYGELVFCTSLVNHNKLHVFDFSGEPGVDETWIDQLWGVGDYRVMATGSNPSAGVVYTASRDLGYVFAIKTHRADFETYPFYFVRTRASTGEEVRWGTVGLDGSALFVDYSREEASTYREFVLRQYHAPDIEWRD